MDFALDLLQGAGIAAAIGIRPFLPLLLVGALASADLGLDFGGTDFAFLESGGFLLLAVLGALAVSIVARRTGRDVLEEGPLIPVLLAVAALGAVSAAGSLADRDHPVLAGIVLGAAAAVLALVAARSFFGRVRKRLDTDARGVLGLYAEAAALAVAGLSVLFPPLALVALAGLAWTVRRGRRRDEQKYAGLRVLR